MTENELLLLRQGLNILVPGYSHGALEKLTVFTDELFLWNRKTDLVGQVGEEFIVRHLLDSLAPFRVFEGLPGSIADVGSGAGLPGIPLAITMPQRNITLIEPSAKRCGFLRNIVLILGLDNLEIIEKPVEEVTRSFEIVTCKAFRPFDRKIINTLRKICSSGGCIAAYKGTEKQLSMELKNSGLSKNNEISEANVEIIELEVPFLEEERHLLKIML